MRAREAAASLRHGDGGPAAKKRCISGEQLVGQAPLRMESERMAALRERVRAREAAARLRQGDGGPAAKRRCISCERPLEQAPLI